ncbi:sensor histidine kinase [Actinoplanes sp. L3-i22]|uniref:sensor histidine kinase n=1 Tax=Actinoplanes sp. L3-i22 TaxID=2836373 RepID=UPI001C7461EC|nr:sensor histidine kinase [Actinoplanes sp. L3-i22]BCY13058.1 histidine kinase [Actinoplanes sp. L3-i22]
MTRRWSIARQLFALQVLVVTLLVAVCTTGAVLLAQRDARNAAIGQVTAVAETIAHSPEVVTALRSEDPSKTLQPYAEATRKATSTDFVVVMAPDRTRYTHPTPALIGHPFAGSVAGALAGGTVVEEYPGSLGDSWRTVVPIRDEAGAIVGLVSVGIRTAAINRALVAQFPAVATGTAAALLLAAAGAWALSRRLGRQTHGLGPAEMTSMYEYYDAVLHSVREGLVVAGRDGRVELINDEARRLLGVPLDGPADLPAEVAGLLAEPRAMVDEPILTGDRILVASRRFTHDSRGSVLTLRDHTELRQLTGELDSVRGLTEALRAQAHEAANRLHTVLTLVELGRPEEAVRLGTEELALAQQLTDQVVGAVREPALAALLLGKSAQAAERGVELTVDPDSQMNDARLPSRDLLTVAGNLVDNALEAVAGVPSGSPRRVRVLVRQEEDEVVVEVSDTGPGLTPEQAASAFLRGWSTKPGAGRGIGLSLVRQIAERHGGGYAISSAPGGGAILTVRLPTARRAAVR